MFRNTSIANQSVKAVCFVIGLIAIGAIAFASIGGGNKSKKSSSVKGDFTPIRTTNGFTLKKGPAYYGSMTFGQEIKSNVISFNSVITYQKGNSTYILPYKYRVQNFNQPHTNLQMFNLRVKIHK